jgi:thiosulfate/3-mercaptopyruvate sulfurtransferase
MPNERRRAPWLFAALSIVVPTTPLRAQATDVPLVVSTQWLAAHTADPRLVIIAVDMSRAVYDSTHIRGAQFLRYDAYAQRRDGLTTEIPPLVALDSILESVGISNDSRIVIYGPPVVSHRLFLTMDVAGLRGQVGMLDGGLDAWRREQRAMATGEPPAVRPGRLVLHARSDVLVDRAWVSGHLNDAAYQFVDARMGGFARGHLAGAANVPAFSLAIPAPADRASWSLPSADSLQRVFAAGGVVRGKQLVAYCAIGETASVVYFAARQMGLPVRFYDGSLEEWQKAPAGALVTSP